MTITERAQCVQALGRAARELVKAASLVARGEDAAAKLAINAARCDLDRLVWKYFYA